jgi:aspartate beta-hydroxylase
MSFIGEIKAAYLWQNVKRSLRGAGADPSSEERLRSFVRNGVSATEPLFADPHQRPASYFPGLTASPWHDPDEFPWHSRLKAAHLKIRRELRALREAGGFQHHDKVLTQKPADWNVFYLYGAGARLQKNCDLCPETAAILDSILPEGSPGNAYFSALQPGAKIASHYGPTNTRLRAHFGVEVPGNCALEVNGEARSSKAGECLVFDDSYYHSAWNRGSATRVVLVFDFWHPELSKAEIAGVAKYLSTSGSAKRIRRRALDRRAAILSSDWWKDPAPR